jgi:3-methyladenine DNA glycosylase AlkD
MRAYMKSAMPFLGVAMPRVRAVTKVALREHPPATFEELETDVRTVWDEAAFREERYAASGLLTSPVATGRLELVPLLEHLATTGAWWDHVDDLARRVAELHDAHPDEAARVVRRWSTADDLWLRRLAIISQLGRKDRLDRDLLAAVVAPNVTDRELFVRKAIGWALREVARIDPGWVRGFVIAHPDLSALSRREALKHL